ncbi:hypothetical protein Bpfe_027027, partial [Biomphalaria pfeifferi]
GLSTSKQYLVNNLSVYESNDKEPTKPCAKASHCGLGGCCLHGWCSTTGSTFNKCYSKVRQNGRVRPVGNWKKTDVCPCDYMSYCFTQKPYKKHPKFGIIGNCFPIMR